MKIYLSKENNILFIYVGKKFSNNSFLELNNYISKVLLNSDIKKVVVNLKDLEVLTPAACNSFVKLKWIMKLKKGSIYFEDVKSIYFEELKKLNLKIKKERVIQ